MNPNGRQLLRIFLLSALILFLEMLLVRWISTELRVFAYLQNGVLVAAFLGLGLGCRNAREPARLLPALGALAALGFVIRDPWQLKLGEAVTQGLVAFQDSVIWSSSAGAGLPDYVRPALVCFSLAFSLALLGATALAFQPLGQWLGAWMDEHPVPITAYSANIAGSLLGIGLFVAGTVLRTPPWSWLLVAGVGLALCIPFAADAPLARAASVGLALALPLFGVQPGARTFWSPYQKLSLEPQIARLRSGGPPRACGELINVNNVSYQAMVDLDPAHMAADPELYPPAGIPISHYILPWTLVGPRERVLIVGAGSGNDAAGALRAGARHVEAVEIDPLIVELGRGRHPNRPYASDRVVVTVDDARAFFRNDHGVYDAVWFGLLDAHTTPSAYANVRLDHFVYTRESFADMKKLVAPSGVVILFFRPQTPWISDRLARLLGDTFGEPPLAIEVESASPCLGWGGLMLIGGSREALAPIAARALADPAVRPGILDIGRRPLDTRVPTDDWPYLYLKTPSVPRYHLLVGLACLGIGVLLRRRLFKPGEPVDGAMLLLGAGFMLLEVGGVSRAALLFGTTWTVNAYVVGAILGMVLLANLVAARIRIPPAGWPLAGLVASILALTFTPTAALAALPGPVRVVVGGGFLALPVFFSGLVFVTAWAATSRKDLALGSNLLGSLVGGVASMLSMLLGFSAMSLLTLAAYLAAWALLARAPAAQP